MMVWRCKDDWVGLQVEDQYVMIYLDSGCYMVFNQIVVEVWYVLDMLCICEELVGLFVG